MNKRKKSRIGLLIVIALFGYFLYIVVGQQRILYAKENEMAGIKAKIEEEKKVNEQLKMQKENINSDEYIEKIAREKLGMVKQGEKIFVDIGK